MVVPTYKVSGVYAQDIQQRAGTGSRRAGTGSRRAGTGSRRAGTGSRREQDRVSESPQATIGKPRTGHTGVDYRTGIGKEYGPLG